MYPRVPFRKRRNPDYDAAVFPVLFSRSILPLVAFSLLSACQREKQEVPSPPRAEQSQPQAVAQKSAPEIKEAPLENQRSFPESKGQYPPAKKIGDVHHAEHINSDQAGGFLIDESISLSRLEEGQRKHGKNFCRFSHFGATGELIGQAREHSCDWQVLQRTGDGFLAIDEVHSWDKNRPERAVLPKCPKEEDQAHLVHLDQALNLKKRTPLTCGVYAWQKLRDGKVLSIGFGERTQAGDPRMSLAFFDGKKTLQQQVVDPSGTYPEDLRKAIIIGPDKLWIGSTHPSTEDSGKFTLVTLDYQLRVQSTRTIEVAPNLSYPVHVDGEELGFWVTSPNAAFMIAKDGTVKKHDWKGLEGVPNLNRGFVSSEGTVISPNGTTLRAALEGKERKDVVARQFEPVQGTWSEGALAFTWWNGHVQFVPKGGTSPR